MDNDIVLQKIIQFIGIDALPLIFTSKRYLSHIKSMKNDIILSNSYLLGRVYQTVTDRIIIEYSNCRHTEVQYIVKRMSNHELLTEYNKIINAQVCGKSWMKLLMNRNMSKNATFYTGRCFQYLLDMDNYTDENIYQYSVESYAVELREKEVLAEAEGYQFHHKMCDCGSYTYPNNRCDCNNIKIYLDVDNADLTLDLTIHDFYPKGPW